MPIEFLGELRAFSFGTIPKNWTPCDGRLMSINQNQPLFALLGTAFGGDGRNTFALPNLQGIVPMHVGPKTLLGYKGGEAKHKLITNEIPAHTHQAVASSLPNPDANTPDNNYWATTPSVTYYASEANKQMAQGCIGFTGQDAGHDNMAPYLAINICIATIGIFPS